MILSLARMNLIVRFQIRALCRQRGGDSAPTAKRGGLLDSAPAAVRIPTIGTIRRVSPTLVARECWCWWDAEACVATSDTVGEQ